MNIEDTIAIKNDELVVLKVPDKSDEQPSQKAQKTQDTIIEPDFKPRKSRFIWNLE